MGFVESGVAAVHILSAASSGLSFRLGINRVGKKFLATMFAAEIGCLSIAFGVDGSGFVNSHSADWILGGGWAIVHGCLCLFVYLAGLALSAGLIQ